MLQFMAFNKKLACFLYKRLNLIISFFLISWYTIKINISFGGNCNTVLQFHETTIKIWNDL